jgi:hypothetical protein
MIFIYIVDGLDFLVVDLFDPSILSPLVLGKMVVFS